MRGLRQRSRNRGRPWLVLAGVVVVLWLLPVSIKQIVGSSFFYFQAPIYSIGGQFRDLGEYLGLYAKSKRELLASSRDLARTLGAYELKRLEQEAQGEELKRLEGILDINADRGFEPQGARVVRRELTGWWQWMVINQGSEKGIEKNFAVVSREGLVGRVKKAYRGYSLVELTSNPTFRISSRLEGDYRPITFQGKGINVGKGSDGKALNVPQDLTKRESQRLFTSKLGGYYPDGLLIGEIKGYGASAEGLFMEGEVNLIPSLNEVREVAVLVPKERVIASMEEVLL